MLRHKKGMPIIGKDTLERILNSPEHLLKDYARGYGVVNIERKTIDQICNEIRAQFTVVG